MNAERATKSSDAHMLCGYNDSAPTIISLSCAFAHRKAHILGGYFVVDKELASLQMASEASSSGIPSFDVTKYMAHVGDFDMTDEQKAEFLTTWWSIMAAFVNLGFGVDSVLPLIAQNSMAQAQVAEGEPSALATGSC